MNVCPTRHDSVLRALEEVSAFTSSSGVMMNDEKNRALRGNTQCSDGADHHRLRRIIAKPLAPMSVAALKEEITSNDVMHLPEGAHCTLQIPAAQQSRTNRHVGRDGP